MVKESSISINISDIVEVIEISSYRLVNEYLEFGWVLLSVGFRKGEVPGYDHHLYCLGRPKNIPSIKEDDYLPY